MSRDNDVYNKNFAGNTPAQLLASVLEQRYSKNTVSAKKEDSIPDPMSFPAVRKALGSVFADFVEIAEEEVEAEQSAMREETAAERTDMRGAVAEMTDQLLDMVDQIEMNEQKKKDEEAHKTRRIMQKRNDPYNREYNFEKIPERETTEITEISMDTLELETSTSKPREHRKFRNGAKAE